MHQLKTVKNINIRIVRIYIQIIVRDGVFLRPGPRINRVMFDSNNMGKLYFKVKYSVL